MKLFIRIISAALIVALGVPLFSACSLFEPEPVCGGTTDRTDPKAPKVIKSKDIKEFYASFYLAGEWMRGVDGAEFTFEVKQDGDGYIASETENGISYPADKEFLSSLQTVIDEEKLAGNNGVWRVTAGLPPEYQKCTLSVAYESGEKLSFTKNNDPYAEWAQKIYMAFSEYFSGKGNDALTPPMTEGKVSYAYISRTEDGVNTYYTPITVGEEDAIDGETEVFAKFVSDAASWKNISKEYVKIPEDFADRVGEIISKHDIRTFDQYSVFYGKGRVVPDEEPSRPLLKIGIQFEDRGDVSIGTIDSSDLEALKPFADELEEYFGSLFEEGND